MKKKIADKWVALLRSGKYKQGKHKLNIDNKEFCCLGVLCEMAMVEGICDYAEGNDVFRKNICSYDGDEGSLPSSVMKWSGMKNSESHRMLAHWNDTGKTFKEIANIIEKNYKQL